MERRTSHLEFTSQLNEKNIVVLEFGRKYTKCGFAGEPSPRAVIKSTVRHGEDGHCVYLHEIEDTQSLESRLGTFIESIYFEYLAVTPKEKKVVIVESVFCRSAFKNALTNVLFDRFNVPSLIFVPDHLMALATLGLNSGLVLDLGYAEAISIAVVDGVTLLDGAQISDLAAISLDECIRTELLKAHSGLEQELTKTIVEDIRVKSCFVAPYDRGCKMSKDRIAKLRDLHKEALLNQEADKLQESLIDIHRNHFLSEKDEASPPAVNYCLGGNRVLTIPGNLREGVCEIFFEISGHEHSLTTMIVETILMAPIDCRKQLSENILLIGGIANLPGLEHRLAKELQNFEPERFQGKIFGDIKFHKPLCARNYVSWLGASMFCSVSFLELRSKTRDNWINGGKKNLPDWCDLVWRDKYSMNKNNEDDE